MNPHIMILWIQNQIHKQFTLIWLIQLIYDIENSQLYTFVQQRQIISSGTINNYYTIKKKLELVPVFLIYSLAPPFQPTLVFEDCLLVILQIN